FFDALSSVLEVLTERLVFDGVPAEADAQSEAAPREDVDRRRLLGNQNGLSLGQDDDAGHEPDPTGDPGQEGEQCEGLVKGVSMGVRPATAAAVWSIDVGS